MSVDGLMLVSVFVLCGAGALLGILVPDRRSPAVLRTMMVRRSGMAITPAIFSLVSIRHTVSMVRPR